MIPLSMAPIDLKLVVKGIHAGRGMERRLSDMGFVKGAEAIIIDVHHRSIMVEVNGCRYGICRGMANKIIVEESDDMDEKTGNSDNKER
jgi:Fe2+ transport system protein FeoA